jgi:hypothetical protein
MGTNILFESERAEKSDDSHTQDETLSTSEHNNNDERGEAA